MNTATYLPTYLSLPLSTHLSLLPPVWSGLCRGDFGRLGHNSASDVFIPKPISALTGCKVQSVACGDTHTLAVTQAGEVYSFGRNQVLIGVYF
jgi:alpha-tubulin suppressor-like RCC1 family protein